MAVNLKKSVRVALALTGENQEWLVGKLGITSGAVSKMLTANTCSTDRLSEIAGLFDMKVSEFIALGE